MWLLLGAEKPGSEEPHFHLNQEEHIKVKQGQLGYFIGHQMHVQSAGPDEEVTIKAGGLLLPGQQVTQPLPYGGPKDC